MRPRALSSLQPFKRLISTSSNIENNEVIFDVKGKVGLITLNRPKVLNVLTLSMFQQIFDHLTEWENKLKVVIIEGSGEKAFCAGGDVKSLVDAKGLPDQCEVFKTEYKLNHLIGTYKIPYVAFIDGITMGGGVGLSLHGKYRVSTTRTVFSMPEAKIGLVPDVGASFFLPRMKGQLGTYLGLTGQTLKGNDCFHAGISNYVTNDIEAVKNDLLSAKNSGHEDVKKILRQHHLDITKDKFSLDKHMPLINEYLKGNCLYTIMDRLTNSKHEFCKDTLKLMSQMSPVSLMVTLKMLRMGRHLDLSDCLKLEYRIIKRCMESPNFYEGVRALLIDKENNPKWNPSSIYDVDSVMVDKYVSMLAHNEEISFYYNTHDVNTISKDDEDTASKDCEDTSCKASEDTSSKMNEDTSSKVDENTSSKANEDSSSKLS